MDRSICQKQPETNLHKTNNDCFHLNAANPGVALILTEHFCSIKGYALQWRHSGRDGVTNYQPRACLLNRADQRKKQSSASLVLVRGIHRWPVNSPHKWPVKRKMFPFDDVIMCLKWPVASTNTLISVELRTRKYMLNFLCNVCDEYNRAFKLSQKLHLKTGKLCKILSCWRKHGHALSLHIALLILYRTSNIVRSHRQTQMAEINDPKTWID